MTKRTIKFRAWDGSQMLHDIGVMPCVPFSDADRMTTQHESYFRPDKWPVMQFTNLVDKNGKEIYEGDICKTDAPNPDYTVVKVWWNKRTAQFCGARNFVDEGLSHDDLSLNIFGEIEVIGNIYETPELLSEGTNQS